MYIAFENSRNSPRSSPMRTFREEERLRLSDRNSITDDVNQCLHGSNGVPNANLFNSTVILVDFGKVVCSSANELRQNLNAYSREEYILQILTVLLKIHGVYIDLCSLLYFVCHS